MVTVFNNKTENKWKVRKDVLRSQNWEKCHIIILKKGCNLKKTEGILRKDRNLLQDQALHFQNKREEFWVELTKISWQKVLIKK